MIGDFKGADVRLTAPLTGQAGACRLEHYCQHFTEEEQKIKAVLQRTPDIKSAASSKTCLQNLKTGDVLRPSSFIPKHASRATVLSRMGEHRPILPAHKP